jgi:hypothetical protein
MPGRKYGEAPPKNGKVLTNDVKRVITLLYYFNIGVTRTKAFCRIAGRLFVYEKRRAV